MKSPENSPAAPPRYMLPVQMETSDGKTVFRAGGQEFIFTGDLFKLDTSEPVKSQLSIREGESTILSLELQAEKTTLLREVRYLAGTWDAACRLHIPATSLQSIVLMVRKADITLFASLDFPYSRITGEGVAYPPNDTLNPDKPYSCHTLSLWACRQSGQKVTRLDRAEIEAVSEYVERRFPQRFDRPMILSACITNRMTDVRGGRIFYSMYDNPTVALDPQTIEDEVRLCAEVGIEYYQVFEGAFDWPDEEKTGASMRKIVKLGRKLGVRIGDYVDPHALYCPHYNYSHRRLDKPEWMMHNSAGKSVGRACLGCKEYVDFLTETLVAHNRKYGEEMICLDFLSIKPCYAKNHEHTPGDVYSQVRGLVQFMKALAETSPDFLVWSNSGNWKEFMPKLVWYNPNVYLTDPVVHHYQPTLNGLKLLDDARRGQTVSVHERYFVPYRNFCNCEYYLIRRSRVNDVHVFEYGLLQGLAVTPNVCLAELRTFLNRIPSVERKHAIKFMREWTDFVRENYDVWKHTLRVGDSPGVGATEIYAHVAGDKGFICLVNQNSFPVTASFCLDGSIGLESGKRFLLSEVYPNRCLLAEQSLPFSPFGQQVNCVIPPHSVRYIQIAPYKKATATVQVYGLPASVEKTEAGYRLSLSAPQGSRLPVGIVLPEGQTIKSVSARQKPTVRMYTFSASAAILARNGNSARVQVVFPREKAPRELTQWKVTPGDVAVELPAKGCVLLGAIVHGAFTEDYEVELDLVVVNGPVQPGAMPAPKVAAPKPVVAVPAAAKQTFTTGFNLPFMEGANYGVIPGYEDDAVIELAFARPNAIKSITARINGKPMEVRKYFYPRRTAWYGYYIELTGNTFHGVRHGRQRLELDIEWR